MFKSTTAFASLAVLFSFQVSQAQTTPPMTMPMAMTCTDGDMAKLQTAMNGMSDAPKKEMAMKEMDMAKGKMAAKDNDDCMKHMENVQKAMQ